MLYTSNVYIGCIESDNDILFIIKLLRVYTLVYNYHLYVKNDVYENLNNSLKTNDKIKIYLHYLLNLEKCKNILVV